MLIMSCSFRKPGDSTLFNVLLTICMIVIVGCADSTNKAENTTPVFTITVIQGEGDTHFWHLAREGMKNYLSERSDDLEVRLQWPEKTSVATPQGQLEAFKHALSSGTQAILLAAREPDAFGEVIEQADSAGIPVVAIQSGAHSSKLLSMVLFDHHKGGRMAGAAIAEALDKKGRVVYLQHEKPNRHERELVSGLETALSSEDNIQLSGSDPALPGDKDDAGNWLVTAMGDSNVLDFDAIFCPTEQTTQSLLKAIEDNALTSRLVLLGRGNNADLSRALMDGRLDGLILEDPLQMGYLGIKTVVRALEGHRDNIAPFTDGGILLATPTNLNERPLNRILVNKIPVVQSNK